MCHHGSPPALRFPPAGTRRCTFALARQVKAQGSLDGRAWGGEKTQVSECLWEAELPVNLNQSAQTEHAFGSEPLNWEGLRCSPLCCVKSHQSCPTLCDPMDCSPPGSSVHGILQARILQWVPMPSGDLSHPGIEPASPKSCVGRLILYH